MELSFDDFKIRAKDSKLSKWEKIGFPDSYRQEIEGLIFSDIARKLNLNQTTSILDIGCGCSDLVDHIIKFSKQEQKELVLIDSEEMLSNIDSKLISEEIKTIAGCFPEKEVLVNLEENYFDAIIVYSVLQYAFINQSIFHFIHSCIKLLKPGGRLLLGDIPNYQCRERFLVSHHGQEFLSKSTDLNLSVDLNHDNEERIDDSVIMSILFRFRQFGCETYLLPQPAELPFSNRREDILIVKRN